jgi:RNase P subunit RPR2
MTRDLAIDAAAGTVVLGWKTTEEGLLLRVRGETEDVRVICRCGRRHLIVHEIDSEGAATLVLICHHCGTRGTFPMARFRMAAR